VRAAAHWHALWNAGDEPALSDRRPDADLGERHHAERKLCGALDDLFGFRPDPARPAELP